MGGKMKYEVKSSRDVVVDGLAVLHTDETRTFTQQEADNFETMRGLKLTQSALPVGVELTVVVEEVQE
jgi:hypothetical protein